MEDWTAMDTDPKEAPMDLAVKPGTPKPGGEALEEAIVAGREGRITSQELVGVIWGSELLSVGRLEDAEDPESFQALVLKAPDGGPAVAATFTRDERIPDRIREAAPMIVQASGEATIRSIASGYGLAINPGSDVGLELGPDGVRAIVAAFDKAAAEAADGASPDSASSDTDTDTDKS